MASLFLAVAGERSGGASFGEAWAPAPPPSRARRALAALAALLLAAGLPLWSATAADAHAAVTPVKPALVGEHDDGDGAGGDGDGDPWGDKARPLATVDG